MIFHGFERCQLTRLIEVLTPFTSIGVDQGVIHVKKFVDSADRGTPYRPSPRNSIRGLLGRSGARRVGWGELPNADRSKRSPRGRPVHDPVIT